MNNREPEKHRNISALEAFPVSTLAEVLRQVRAAAKRDTKQRYHTVKVVVSEAVQICSSLLENGLPRNPASRAMLRQLYAPELAQDLIRLAIGGEWEQPDKIEAALTLCFVLHPEAIISEVGVITRLPGAVPRSSVDRVVFWGVNDGGNEMLSEAVFTALGRGCHIEPRLWSLFRQHYRREADWYLGTLSVSEITKLPDVVAEHALHTGKRSAQDVSDILPSLIKASPLQDLPGLFAALRFVRDTSNARRLPKELVRALAHLVERESGSPTSSEAWCHRGKVGEPRRSEQQPDVVLIKAVERLLQWGECVGTLRRSAWRRGYLSDRGTEKVWGAQVIVDRITKEKELLLEPLRRYCRFTLDLQARGFNDTEVAALVASVDLLMGYEIDTLGALLKKGAQEFFAQIRSALLKGDKGSFCNFVPLYYAHCVAGGGLHRSQYGWILREALTTYQAPPSPVGKHAWSVLFSAVARRFTEGEISAMCERINNGNTPGHFVSMLYALLDHKDLRANSAPWLEKMSRKPDGFWEAGVFLGQISILPALQVVQGSYNGLLPEGWTSDPTGSASLAHAMTQQGLLSSHVVTESPEEAGLQSQVCSLNLDLAACTSEGKPVHAVAIRLNAVVDDLFSEYRLADGVFENVKAALGRHQLTKRDVRQLTADLSAHVTGAGGGNRITRQLLATLNEIEKHCGRGRTVEELRQALEAAKLIQYTPRRTEADRSTAVYLRRFGLSPQNVTRVVFSGLRFLGRGPRDPLRHDPIDSTFVLPAEDIDPDRLNRALDFLWKRLRAECTDEVLRTRLDLMRIPLQRRIASQRAARLGGILLMAGLSSYSVWGGYLRKGGDQVVARTVPEPRGKLSFGGNSLRPNGSIPKREGAATVCTLSKPLPEDNCFLLTNILGSGRSATRPSLVEASPECATLLESVIQARRSGKPRGEQVTMSFAEIRGGSTVPISVGGTVERISQGSVFSQSGVYIGRELGDRSVVDVSLPPEVVLDPTMTIQELQLRVGGPKYSVLWTPSLSPNELKRLSPTLWQSIEEARAMPVIAAITHLQVSVQNFMPYEAVPEYDSFRGSTADYIRAICTERRGICGQYAELFEEVSAHAGIPGCLVAGLKASPVALEVTTADAHATNLFLLPAKDGRLVPLVIDATGVSSEVSMPNRAAVAERKSVDQGQEDAKKARERKREGIEEGLKLPTLDLMTFIATAGIAGGVMRRPRIPKERVSPQLPKVPEKGESPSTAPAESSPVVIEQIPVEFERNGVVTRAVLQPVRVHSDWIRYYADGLGGGTHGTPDGSSTAIAGTTSPAGTPAAPLEFWESLEDGGLERYTKWIGEVSARFEPTSAEAKMLLQKVPSALALVTEAASNEAGHWSTRVLCAWAQWVQDPSHAREWLSRIAHPERFAADEQQAIIAAVVGLLPPTAQSEARRVLPRFFAWSQLLRFRRSPHMSLNCLLHAFSPPEEGSLS